MKRYVFDSSALISYLDGENNAEAVAELLEEINSKEYSASLSIINLGEIYYHFLRTGGIRAAVTYLNSISSLPVELIDADLDLTLQAANYKAFNKISYADCFAAALAKIKKAQLITSDREFKQIEKEIDIKWV